MAGEGAGLPSEDASCGKGPQADYGRVRPPRRPAGISPRRSRTAPLDLVLPPPPSGVQYPHADERPSFYFAIDAGTPWRVP